ncbi:hypothetical protein D3C87_1340360 [compost metagenome]
MRRHRARPRRIGRTERHHRRAQRPPRRGVRPAAGRAPLRFFRPAEGPAHFAAALSRQGHHQHLRRPWLRAGDDLGLPQAMGGRRIDHAVHAGCQPGMERRGRGGPRHARLAGHRARARPGRPLVPRQRRAYRLWRRPRRRLLRSRQPAGHRLVRFCRAGGDALRLPGPVLAGGRARPARQRHRFRQAA